MKQKTLESPFCNRSCRRYYWSCWRDPGKITLYKGKEVMKRNVNSEVAVEELINLIKENEAWVEAI